MARQYSGKKGKSGSKKPLFSTPKTWVRYSPKEIERLVVKFGKQGIKPSKIGLILRDSYGIPSVKEIVGKKITKILEEHNIKFDLPEDLESLIKRAIRIREHFKKHKHDMTAKRGLILTESKIRKLVKYYKRIGKLPKEWKYDPEKAKLIVS